MTNIDGKICKLLIALTASTLTVSCSYIKGKDSMQSIGPIAEASKKEKIIAVVGIGADKKLKMFNSESGKLLDSCEKRKATKNPCRATAKKDKKGNIILRNGKPIMINSEGKEHKVIDYQSVSITHFEGSYCVSGYSFGQEYVSCSHGWSGGMPNIP